MNCPKCGGRLTVTTTHGDDVNDYIDIDFECEDNDEHLFWYRIYKKELTEE